MSKKRLSPSKDASKPASHLEREPARPPLEAQRRTLVHIRWMIRRDMPEVLAIDEASAHPPWDEESFVACLRQQRNIGMVAEWSERVVGFFLYSLHRNRLGLLNMAVHPDFRRQRVGEQILQKLVGKLEVTRRTRILLEVRETNLAAQLFFRAMGFRAISMQKNFYPDTREDAYVMQYRHVPPPAGGDDL